MEGGVGSSGGGGGGGSDGEKMKPPESGESKVKRKMKTAAQLEILEKTYAVEAYPAEALRAELSLKLGLTDRQLQMWFCHRRLKDRKTPPQKRPRKDDSPAAAVAGSSGGVGDEMVAGELGNEHGGSGSASASSPFRHVDLQQKQQRAVPRTGIAMARITPEMPPLKRYYEPPQAISELRAIQFVELQLGEPLREDGPILGMEFDPLPPGAFGAPIVTVGQQKAVTRPYESNLYERPDVKPSKGAMRALHEYQFLPEQPSIRNDAYERSAPSHYYGSPTDVPSVRNTRPFVGGSEQVSPGYGFQGQLPSLNLLPHQGRQGHALPSLSGDYDIPHKSPFPSIATDAHFSNHPINQLDNSPSIPPERRTTNDDEISRVERKRKSEEARIAKEVEAHEKRIRKELEKQDILRRKREEQMKKEMERQDRERRKEEERLLRERQREEERHQREQKREMERREKFLQKESVRAEKMRLKEEMRKEKEAARQKAANERATARRIAKESTELIEDERLELMELAASSKGFPSILALDGETLQDLDIFRDKLIEFPPTSVRLEKPLTMLPWSDSEENIGNLLMVWRFIITFADVLEIWPFTLDEFVQAFHDYDAVLLGEIHMALLRSIVKDIEDVARTPANGLGANQNSSVSPGGGHPHIIEGAYAWGFDIGSWQHRLNPLTWPEILRQFALAAGFGPKLKRRSIEQTYAREENEGNDGEDIISNLRNGAAAENAVAKMQERGFANSRRSRHRLTPGTVKYAAFHILSLEGSKGLAILDVADKIQKSGLRDLTTSKTPEASIAAALSRDTKLFERTAPSTYCVRAPYRKDPADAETILSTAREKIQIFKNGCLDGEDAEDVERDDVERDEDSESDAAEYPDADDLGTELKQENEAISYPITNSPQDVKGTFLDDAVITPDVGLQNPIGSLPVMKSEEMKEIKNTAVIGVSVDGTGVCNESAQLDQEETVIDESNRGEPWAQRLMEVEYCDLSVEERLNALVALIGMANEGNSIRVVLEERLESANSLKKQMWAGLQVDKRRMKEEYAFKYTSFFSKSEPVGQTLDGPLSVVDDKNNLLPTNTLVQKELTHDMNHPPVAIERNAPNQELGSVTDNLSLLQPGYAAERSRSQFKSYISYKAEETHVYRSLPLGQDRRRNRYWQFITFAENDTGTGRIFVELRNGCWRLIDSEESFDALLSALDVRGLRESHLHSMLQRVEIPFKETVKRSLTLTNTKDPSIDRVKVEVTDAASNPNCTVSTSTMRASNTFPMVLGRNKVEKTDVLKRYRRFENWIWKQCLSSKVLCAIKYGKKRCKQLFEICPFCHNVYRLEDGHDPCPASLETSRKECNFGGYVGPYKEKFEDDDSSWFREGSGSCPRLGISLLKALSTLIEVSIPEEALLPAWFEGYRESWGLKLDKASSAEDFLEILTTLESFIKKDFLSSDFETTEEMLASFDHALPDSESGLPWIPLTSSAVALRLMELDASISYVKREKIDLLKDKGAEGFMSAPPRFTPVKSFADEGPVEAIYEPEILDHNIWADPRIAQSSSGRGRPPRGRGRGRSRGGRSQPKAASSGGDAGGRFGQLLGWRGRSSSGRGGRKKGRRTSRGRQKPVKHAVDESPNMIYENNNTINTSLLPQWNREEEEDDGMDFRPVGGENPSSGSDRSEYDDDYNGQSMADEFDDDMMVDDYSTVFNGKPGHLGRLGQVDMEYNIDAGDEDYEQDDEEEVGSEEDEHGDTDVERYINDGDDSEEENLGGDGARTGNPEDVTESSSDYSR